MCKKLKWLLKTIFLMAVVFWAVFPITVARTANFGGYDGYKLVGSNTNAILMVSTSGNSSSRLEIQMGAILWYEPMIMSSGSTLPDRINTQNGTINWGSNSGVALTYGEMSSYESYEASSNASSGFGMTSAPMPATWFAAGENLSSLPFYESFSQVAAQTGQPVQVFYFWAVIGVAFGAFIAIVGSTRSALMAYIAMVAVFAIGSSMTIIPAWIVFVLIVIGAAIMYLYKQVSY